MKHPNAISPTSQVFIQRQAAFPSESSHQSPGPLPGYPHGRVPRPKLPGPLLNGRRPDFWVVNPNNNKLVVPRAARRDPRGKLPGVRTLLEGWTGRGLRTREEVLGEPLSEEEITELIEGAVHERREVYLGEGPPSASPHCIYESPSFGSFISVTRFSPFVSFFRRCQNRTTVSSLRMV